ncbi:MAG: helix-turn-helix transcriptional regulator [Chryseolinea sp.]
MKKYVLLTAKDQVNLDSLAVGRDYVVSQPFDWKDLQMLIQRLMKRRVSQKRIDEQVEYKPKKIAVASVNELLMQRIMKVVEENMTKADFSVEVFAKEVGMSTAQLYRKVTALTGYAPNDFMRHMRLQRAADLLMQKAGNVSEIGYQVGFNNLSYFSKCFKEKFGTLPSSFLGSRCGDLK